MSDDFLPKQTRPAALDHVELTVNFVWPVDRQIEFADLIGISDFDTRFSRDIVGGARCRGAGHLQPIGDQLAQFTNEEMRSGPGTQAQLHAVVDELLDHPPRRHLLRFILLTAHLLLLLGVRFAVCAARRVPRLVV